MSAKPAAPLVPSPPSHGEFASIVAALLGPNPDRESARAALATRLDGCLEQEGLLGAFVFVFDEDVADYVLVSGRLTLADRGEIRRAVQRLVRRSCMPTANHHESTSEDDVASLPFGIVTRRLEFETHPVGAVAAVGVRANEVLTRQPELVDGLVTLLLAYRQSVRLDEFARGQQEMVQTKARLETALRELERHTGTIETMNRELLRFRAHARRVATLGELVAGVAHEINNPLAYVMTSLDFIQEQLARVAPMLSRDDARSTGEPELMTDLLEAAADATDGARRIRDIARDLRSLSRTSDANDEPVVVENVVASAVRVTAPQVRPHADVECDLTPGLTCTASAGQLSQVIANLLINAAHAIADAPQHRGHITIRSTGETDSLVISVSDDGPGIPERIRAQVLDPFFTTKPEGQGTGLGLSISSEIVRRFGGELSLNSTVGVGTTFRIVLPRLVETTPSAKPPPPPDERSPHSPRSAGVPKRARLLFIDDEPAMLRSYAQRFGAAHDVVLANGPVRALEMLDQRSDFDLVVCDLELDGSSATRFSSTVDERWPELTTRMVFVTASGDPSVRAELDRPLLEKPFELTAIDEILVDRQADN